MRKKKNHSVPVKTRGEGVFAGKNHSLRVIPKLLLGGGIGREEVFKSWEGQKEERFDGDQKEKEPLQCAGN